MFQVRRKIWLRLTKIIQKLNLMLRLNLKCRGFKAGRIFCFFHSRGIRPVRKLSQPHPPEDYLASGRPILIHAPPYAYVSQYAKEYGFAHIVDEESIPLLQDGIRKLLQDHDYSRKLIKNARELFLKNHDAVKNAELLKKIINKL